MLDRSIFAVIVTYHPQSFLVDHLASIKSQVKQVVVVDNTEDDSSQNILSILKEQGCHVIKNNANLGIGRSQNLGIHWAIEKGCTWVLTLDDDTIIYDGLIELYTHALDDHLGLKNAGIISTQYIDINSGQVLGAPGQRGSEGRWLRTDFLISSGSFFSVETFTKAGGFREEFFLDWVDHDFCFKVRCLGLNNFIYTKPMFEHAMGHKTQHKIPLVNMMVTTNNHPAGRCYLIARNLLVLIKESFLKNPGLSLFYIMYLAHKFALLLFFEQDRRNKLSFFVQGVRDALCNRGCSYQDTVNRMA
ncbi:MAG: glycosyltransferase [Candidatus Omnitrophica bacterium]|nr:glycosyltransferase [Candidatus Omnitrophota bacterium]